MIQLITRRKRTDFEFGTEGTQTTGLALFIILLAFFIMLSGMSGFSLRKAQEVTASLREAFGISSFVYAGGDGDALRASGRARNGAGTSIQDVMAAFEHEVPGLQKNFIRRSGVLQMQIALSTWHRLLGLAGKNESMAPALIRLVQFMNDPRHSGYRLVITLGERPALFPGPSPLQAERLVPRWLDRFARAGLASDRVIAGVSAGPAGAVTLALIPVQMPQDSAGVVPQGDLVPPTVGSGGAP